MARTTVFTWKGFFWRFIFALILVLATYNPEGYSYFHWIKDYNHLELFGAAKLPLTALAGLVLLIAWVVFLRAAWHSLRPVGMLLVLGLFGLLVWLFVSLSWLDLHRPGVLSYVSIVILAAVLAIGMSWSFIQRRLTGQVDVVEVADEDH
jgi:uncharacterized protein DUF6524